jgi:hypothetical protein
MTAAASDSVKCTSSVTPRGRWLRSSSRDNINHGLIAAHFRAVSAVAVAVPIGNVSLDGQSIRIDRTASESGGRRDIRQNTKTRSAERTVMIPDIAMPAVRRLADRGAPGRNYSGGTLYGRLINGDRGGYIGYAMWRRYLKLAQGYTAAHPDGIVSYTAHELRHVCASLLVASGASDMQVAIRWGTARSRRPRTSTATVRPGPGVHPGCHEPGSQPSLRVRETGPGGRRRRKCLA